MAHACNDDVPSSAYVAEQNCRIRWELRNGMCAGRNCILAEGGMERRILIPVMRGQAKGQGRDRSIQMSRCIALMKTRRGSRESGMLSLLRMLFLGMIRRDKQRDIRHADRNLRQSELSAEFRPSSPFVYLAGAFCGTHT